MTSRPVIRVLVPWNFERIAKKVQGEAQGNHQIRLNGDRAGMRVTATIDDFLRLGLARESQELSDPIVGRLRTAKINVTASRTAHLPGKVGVVEISTKLDSGAAQKIANGIAEQGSPDIITIYDRAGRGHTAGAEGLARKGAALVGIVPRGHQGVSRTGKRVRAAENRKHNELVNAIRDVWEKNGDDMVQLVDWDMSEYEPPEVRDLVQGVLDQYLSDDQLETWENLEREVQSAILARAFPWNEIQSTKENLDQHFENRCRGASSNKPRTLEAHIDPMDVGLRDPSNLVIVNGRGTINDLFS